mgnify:CR=1 FL=1
MLFRSLQNSRKVYDGRQAGLFSPAIMGPKAAAEDAFRRQVASRPEGRDVEALKLGLDAHEVGVLVGSPNSSSSLASSRFSISSL